MGNVVVVVDWCVTGAVMLGLNGDVVGTTGGRKVGWVVMILLFVAGSSDEGVVVVGSVVVVNDGFVADCAIVKVGNAGRVGTVVGPWLDGCCLCDVARIELGVVLINCCGVEPGSDSCGVILGVVEESCNWNDGDC